jgi:SAM-dependent methyltransferase
MRFWSERMPYLREFAKTHRVLHMGPGREERFGVAVDNLRSVQPDVLVDLNRAPYPFRENTFDAVYAFSVIEHLDNFFGVFGELHRILKPGGFVALLTPHFSDDASYIDPSHRLHLSMRSFDYFIEGTDLFSSFGFYSSTRFRIRERLLMLKPPWARVPLMQKAANRMNALREAPLLHDPRRGDLPRARGREVGARRRSRSAITRRPDWRRPPCRAPRA